jgi:diguanylate cyclase (GGDEF)-like protein
MRKIIPKIKKYLFALLLTAIALILIVQVIGSIENENKNMSSYIKRLYENIDALSNVSIKNKSNVTQLLYDDHIDEETAFILSEANNADTSTKNALREEMYSKHQLFYEQLSTIGIRQFQFHLPNAESFFRFHKPDAFGDSLVEIRETVNTVIKTQKKADGIEEGRVRNGYRYVFPVMYESHYVGSVELSYSLRNILSPVLSTYGLSAVYLINKSEVDEKTYVSITGNYITDVRFPEGYIDKDFAVEGIEVDLNIDKNNFLKLSDKALSNIEKGLFKSEGLTYIVVDDQLVWAMPVEVLNFSGEQIGSLIYYKNDNVLYEMYRHKKLQLNYAYITLFVSLTLVLLSVYMYIKVEHKATMDSLTKLHNRHYYKENLSTHIKTGIIFMIDIDDFKHVNDLHGHSVGDKVIANLAQILMENIRKSDHALRWGGEEFLIILRDAGIEEAYTKALTIRNIVNNQTLYGISITISIGISILDHNFEKAIKEADEAMYYVKEHGKNNVHIFKGSN